VLPSCPTVALKRNEGRAWSSQHSCHPELAQLAEGIAHLCGTFALSGADLSSVTSEATSTFLFPWRFAMCPLAFPAVPDGGDG
jgi:hypothetical protein